MNSTSTLRHGVLSLAVILVGITTPIQAQVIDDVEDVLRWVDHTPMETEPASCVVQIRGEDLGRLAMTVARIALTAPVVVIEPAELADIIGRLATHLTVSPS